MPELEHKFGTGTPFSLGVERELHACQVELISEVLAAAAD
jgi:hypothetical protein